ncbi:MAG: maleylpyruvate isomerase N-terminal domain-containing protein [Acidimicrobiales bacterium]
MTVDDPRLWTDGLAGAHGRLASVVESLDADALRQPSYCDQWTVAQVLSHLGSGAEIAEMVVANGLAGRPAPSRDAYGAIWDRWNALAPEDQAGGFLSADARATAVLVGAVDRLALLRIPTARTEVDGIGFAGMRLNEHALHAWDVRVALDPGATVDQEAVELLLGRLPAAGYAGHADRAGDDRPFTEVVAVADAPRAFSVEVGDDVRIGEVDGPGTAADVHLPGEAVLRLVYGRLDPAHRPPVDARELPALDRLGRIFTGF